MSLLTSFPEVESFFMKRSFSGDDLDQLVHTIDELYKDKNLRAAARSLVSLKLLQYELAGHDSSRTIAPKTKQKRTPNTLGRVGKKTSTNDHVIKQDDEEYFHYSMEQLRHNSVNVMAMLLNLSIPKLLTLLKSKGIDKSFNDHLTIDEFNAMSSIFT